MIRTETMSVSVAIGEESALQHFIGTRLDTGNHVCRIKGQLFHVGEVVFRIAIQHQLAYLYQWELLMRPNLQRKVISFVK